MALIPKDSNHLNKYVVTQSNSLVEANYSQHLSTRALKVARLLISSLSPKIQQLERIEIEISVLKNFLGYTKGVTWGRFHDDLKDIMKRLNNENIEINSGKGKTTVSVFLASYTLDTLSGKVTFTISPELAPYLLQLKKNYTSYLLINIPKLRSSYSIRLYELLHQYRRIGQRSFKLEDLQKKVGANYPYGDFKRRIILKAQKDLKKHTDLAFTFTETKTGRKVTGVDFIILGNKPQQKNPNQLSFLEDAIQTDDKKEKPAFAEIIIKTLNELGISEQNISKYLALGFDIIEGDKEKKKAIEKRYETLGDYYLEKLELTKHSNTNGNAAGFFIKALKEDWVNNKTVAKAKAVEVQKKRHATKKKLEKLSAHIEKLSKKKEKIKQSIIADLIADDSILETAYNHATQEMGAVTKKHLSASAILHLPIKKQYEKSIYVSSGIAVYLMENYPNNFKEAAAIEQKITQAQQKIQAIKKEYPSIN